MLRSLRPETKDQRDPHDVLGEFIGHLDRASRRPMTACTRAEREIGGRCGGAGGTVRRRSSQRPISVVGGKADSATAPKPFGAFVRHDATS
jgi:hypothetical protein